MTAYLDDIIEAGLLHEMVVERFINRQYHPRLDLTIWNYGKKAQFDNVWNEATTQCRGLITNGSGRVVARPFRKFFNLNQLATIPDGPFVASDKMDGSLGIGYMSDPGPAIATRGSFTSDQAVWASEWLSRHPLHERSVEAACAAEATMLFEIIYPANRIVVDYGNRAELVWLSTINNATGNDTPHDFGWPGAKAARHHGLDMDAITAMNAPNTEGFVLQWGDGTRAKVKFAEYLRLHKILTGVNARTIWEMLANNQPLGDLFEVVPDEFHQWARSIIDDLIDRYATIECWARHDLATVPLEAERRDQAEIIKRADHPGIVFAMLDGKEYAHMIWKLIKPEASTPFAQDETT